MSADHGDVGNAPIDMLPEEVLLQIFGFYLCGVDDKEEWETLVHVCRRWRSVVFMAPLRLDLRLVCTAGTPARKMSGIWPELPIVIRLYWLDEEIEDDVLAALKQKDRICELYVYNTSNHGLKSLAEVTKVPPPALTDLLLESFREMPIVPDSLLRGSAPHLRSLHLRGVRFPAFPQVLSSATDLVDLSLCDFPNITPWVMADCLPSLTRLEKLRLDDPYSQRRPDQASDSPPLIRNVLPVLTKIAFKGPSEYLHHFFSHFDAPLLKHVDITFYDTAVFCLSTISQFIGHNQSFELFDQAHMWWSDWFVNLTLSSTKSTTGGMWLKLSMWCKHGIWKLQSLTQAHHPFSHPVVTNDRIDNSMFHDGYGPYWEDQTRNAQWLEFLRFFAAVENLYLSETLARLLAPVLGELSAGESTPTAREVLPVLQTVFIERIGHSSGSVREAIGKFIAEREISNHPVAMHRWKTEFYNRPKLPGT